MLIRPSLVAVMLAAGLLAASFARAQDDLLKQLGLETPEKNSADEPLAPQFSLEKAVSFLDAASIDWQGRRACFTCHTNYAYLYARPLAEGGAKQNGESKAHAAVRAFAEELVNKRWAEKGPRWDAEVVATAAALAFNDAITTGKLHAATRTALDRMWTLQRSDGGWDWIKCAWPPMESDDDYGVLLAAIAAGVAPEGYARTEEAKAGLAKIRSYLAKNPPPTLHHRAMLVWAASYLPDFATADQRAATVAELKKLQLADGGWSAASLGNWTRSDGKPQDTHTSDGYGTGFSVYVLCRAGVDVHDATIARGVSWIKTHQRASGRWYARSLNKDNHHFLSHAGTAFAVMALDASKSLAAEAGK